MRDHVTSFFSGCRPKKLKEGRTKYNKPHTKEVEKVVIMITKVKECGVFEPHRYHDVQTEALGNTEHCSHVRGISSKQS